MDAEKTAKLINEVKKHRELWDLDLKKKVDKYHIIQLWEEISVELDLPISLLKKKWANLRHTYRIALKKGWITWKHIEQMSFIYDYMLSDPLGEDGEKRSQFDESYDIQNTFTESLEDFESINSEGNSAFNNDINDDEFNDCSSPVYSVHKRRKRRKSANRKEDSEYLEVEMVERKAPSNISSEDKMDGDYNFLSSFLPIMKEMTNMQKLEFRAQMSNVALNIMRSPSAVSDGIDFENPSSSCFRQNWK